MEIRIGDWRLEIGEKKRAIKIIHDCLGFKIRIGDWRLETHEKLEKLSRVLRGRLTRQGKLPARVTQGFRRF